MKPVRVLFHCGHFDKSEISFRVIKFISTTPNKIIRKETSAHAFILSKPELLAFTVSAGFSRTSPETKFYFILPTMKSNVNRIYFMVG